MGGRPLCFPGPATQDQTCRQTDRVGPKDDGEDGPGTLKVSAVLTRMSREAREAMDGSGNWSKKRWLLTDRARCRLGKILERALERALRAQEARTRGTSVRPVWTPTFGTVESRSGAGNR